MKHLQIAALAVGLMVPVLACADDGPELAKGVETPAAKPATTRSSKPHGPQARWPEPIKHRNARYAVLTRSFDATGDDHEVFVLNYELRRLFDKLGDYDEKRIHRQYTKGLKRVIHARVAREGDPLGDRYQKQLARLPLSRRFADFRRTRDFTGDKTELAQWRIDRLRHGDLGPKRIEQLYQAQQKQDAAGRMFHERAEDKSESSQQDKKTNREEERDEADFERSLSGSDPDRTRERRAERDEERDEEAVEDEERDKERDEEREEERELDEETEKAIESSDEGGTGIE